MSRVWLLRPEEFERALLECAQCMLLNQLSQHNPEPSLSASANFHYKYSLMSCSHHDSRVQFRGADSAGCKAGKGVSSNVAHCETRAQRSWEKGFFGWWSPGAATLTHCRKDKDKAQSDSSPQRNHSDSKFLPCLRG